MGRKKKKQSKPWCWYCNREFDDEKILIQHQKAKHFKCHICHKKLYTGPGLSIHCMQVHKETIDKVPNSQPNRGNIEIEIYGMEGIPQEDLQEHERNKGGNNDDEDGPEAKRAKSDSPASGLAPTPPVVGPAGPLGGMVVPGLPGMAPRPPFGVSGIPPGWGAPAMPVSSPTTYASHPTGPNGARPLFPSAAGGGAASSSGSKPTFPAYGDTNGEKKPAMIATTTATTRIVHPPEDISLEERRAKMPKYAPPVSSVSAVSTSQQAQHLHHQAQLPVSSQHLMSGAMMNASIAAPPMGMQTLPMTSQAVTGAPMMANPFLMGRPGIPHQMGGMPPQMFQPPPMLGGPQLVRQPFPAAMVGPAMSAMGPAMSAMGLPAMSFAALGMPPASAAAAMPPRQIRLSPLNNNSSSSLLPN
ncbi:BUB3-interacting and GLEBS motif-containing protein ZNF207-like isoform X1 [Tigriopus californicus]|uniref:BUB3-interacting and GLEBS motif-containing protein ZNF207-like isoform X1 n=1 Tax=Tigriopus californicus TaxID=6832 RepID=UPI0027D9D813|nr:BUB3-interacting and GLEBS motif-containing protein ZNF207-like isoform X1 [Tigriopus californicus]XP_059093725.1 BUB3-interacting and GLEBS motif-containing protein ZNF207-like isoform X1 [Tigriopus californicus]XP_059093733.1 BUB3-interacting and GLEBS motif-containing protein ZNF207-like isoform X1 [Tigriopus californicus]XP_059093740.1 BUB3-interacting and GLEBS motif-containing protein ZNF207-like isoform X1 [Tigriopus californicus]